MLLLLLLLFLFGGVLSSHQELRRSFLIYIHTHQHIFNLLTRCTDYRHHPLAVDLDTLEMIGTPRKKKTPKMLRTGITTKPGRRGTQDSDVEWRHPRRGLELDRGTAMNGEMIGRPITTIMMENRYIPLGGGMAGTAPHDR